MAASPSGVNIEVDGRTLTVTNPDKVFFSARGETKLDLVQYYFAVAPGALRGVRERPTVLKRFPDGAEGDFFYQKRVPAHRPPWLETVTVTFPSGRSAQELCPVDTSHILWAVNLGCLDLNPTSCVSTSIPSPTCLSTQSAEWPSRPGRCSTSTA
jgi:DNA primase